MKIIFDHLKFPLSCQTLFINLNIFCYGWLRIIYEGWLTPGLGEKNSVFNLVHLQFWMRNILIYFGAVDRTVNSASASCQGLVVFLLPNYLQEINRQNSTSSAPLFLRWVGDESLRDDRKKAAKCVVPKLPSLSCFLCRLKRFIYSSSEQKQHPLVAENQIGQPNAEMHETHTIWVHSFLCTSAQSQKTQSYPANDLRQIITDAEHPYLCLSVHFVRNSKIKKELKWDPDQNWCV